ncbi:MAG TPA: hypothetical protein VMV52_02170 [Candidatus Nanopelagicaceae bacterium]|nr:hypothetical protein [Candidatus Nanopelagicaceae bacterium]
MPPMSVTMHAFTVGAVVAGAAVLLEDVLLQADNETVAAAASAIKRKDFLTFPPENPEYWVGDSLTQEIGMAYGKCM